VPCFPPAQANGNPQGTMEVVNAYKEDVQFTNVANTRGYVSGSSAKVGGTHPIGPWKTFKIKQGDVVNGEVYARYETSSTGSGINLSLYLTNPSNFRGGSESNRNPALLNLGLGLSPVTNPPAGVPKAQLRYLFYDKDNKFISSQSVAVTASAANSWLKLTLPQFSASQDGYLQVLVVNESNVDVWFDDLSITHTEALIVQENHYDPWGLNLAGIETQGQPDHKFQYNGKEKQQEFGMALIDYGQRNYDAQLGRFFAVDRFAEKYYDFSPYQYGANNPIKYIDVNGDSLMLFKNGEYVTTVDNGKKEITGFNQESKTDKKGKETFTGGQSFSFNDIDLDKESLTSGEVTLSFLSKNDVKRFVDESGAGNQNFMTAWSYAATESNAGNLDFYTKLADDKFYIIGGVGYNTHDAGNYLWGNAMARMGFGQLIPSLGAHINAWWSGKESNGEAVTSHTHNAFERAYLNRTWSGDSAADQRAIKAGYEANTYWQEYFEKMKKNLNPFSSR